MIDPPLPVFIHRAERDQATLYHCAVTGKLVGIHQDRKKRGATIINRAKFDASLARHNPPAEPWFAFLGGLVIGAACAFTLTAVIFGCAWWMA